MSDTKLRDDLAKEYCTHVIDSGEGELYTDANEVEMFKAGFDKAQELSATQLECKVNQIDFQEHLISDLESKLKIAISALKTCVGHEPFDGLEPRKASEALSTLQSSAKDNKNV